MTDRHAEKAKPRTLVLTVPGMIGEQDLAPLRQLSAVEYREISTPTEDELAEMCDGFDYLMLNYDVAPRLTERFYASPRVRSLRAIAADLTGMDWSSPRAAAAVGVKLLNIPHYSSQSVAETVLAEVFLHSRARHAAYVDELRGRKIEERKGINLQGRTAGVVGLGSIGTRVGELLGGLGMKVIAWNRTPRDSIELVTLEDLFSRADIICVALKTVKEGNDANVKIIGRALLERCHGTIIVNLANVALVDHEAMLDALESGKVAGYSVERKAELLDSPIGTRLAHHEHVHLPPSNSWFSDESLQTLRETWVGNVLADIRGMPQNVYRD